MRSNKISFSTNFLLPIFTRQFNLNFVNKLKLNSKAIDLQSEVGSGENLIIFLSVSGCGRDTVLEECLTLVNKSERIKRISTRCSRGDLKKVDHMVFLGEKGFIEKFKTKEILFAGRYNVNNKLYGISCKELLKTRNKENLYFIESTLIGLSLKKLFPKSCLIVLIPPSFDFLRNRLLSRHDEDCLKRFNNSCLEIESIISNIREMIECRIVDLALVNINSKRTANKIVEFLRNPERTDDLKKEFFEQIRSYE